MRHAYLSTALLLAASAAVAAPPAHSGPPIDLVAAPRVAPTPVYFPFWGGFGYWDGYYSPGYYYSGFYAQPANINPPPLATSVNPVRAAEDADRAAAYAPATLSLELPAAADVWLDGEKQPSSTDAARKLLSPPMKLGAEYTFRIRARWVEGGTTYEATPTSTVRAGERGKLTVYAGTVVK